LTATVVVRAAVASVPTARPSVRAATVRAESRHAPRPSLKPVRKDRLFCGRGGWVSAGAGGALHRHAAPSHGGRVPNGAAVARPPPPPRPCRRRALRGRGAPRQARPRSPTAGQHPAPAALHPHHATAVGGTSAPERRRAWKE
jgi:hypothetical protein